MHKSKITDYNVIVEQQPSLFDSPVNNEPDLNSYQKIIVFFSGGKDSQASVLQLLKLGIKPEKIELHHHCVDGQEGSTLMDWPCTESYCRAFAEAFNLPLYFSWKEGGFEREMLRDKNLTAPIIFQTPNGQQIKSGGERGSLGTRLKFPQVSANLQTRWCSSYLKIDVGARIITQQERFADGGKYLVVTGERSEESPARSHYSVFEPHRTDNRQGKRIRRHIDHYRPVHGWTELEVWEILREYHVNPHPAYHCGWGRTSCMTCIFGSVNQWATIRKYMPEWFERIADYEVQFNHTINRKYSIRELADKGTPYNVNPYWLGIALAKIYNQPIILKAEEWEYPAGAFGESNGPT